MSAIEFRSLAMLPLRRVAASVRTAEFRTWLLWCLPALLVAIAIRAVLMAQLPHGYYHDDTHDFFSTPEELLKSGRFTIAGKKTFLVPLLYTVPFFVKIPALIFVPALQHGLGVVLVALVGGLCRLWFRFWKIIILPVTLIVAVNPNLLWFEHTLLAESIFLFTVVLVAFAATLYALCQSGLRFAFLCVALVLAAGGRPEGKLLFPIILFELVLLHWRDLLVFAKSRELRLGPLRLLVFCVIAFVMHEVTQTSQAGLLLYTSVVRLTPTELRCAPGFDPFIAPLREDLQRRWSERPNFAKVQDRRVVSEQVQAYLKSLGKKRDRDDVNALCMKLAMETCRRNLPALPMHVLQKFRRVAIESPALTFHTDYLIKKQRDSLLGCSEQTARLGSGMAGTPLTTPEEVDAFLQANYREIRWFNKWSDDWQDTVNALHLPDRLYLIPGKLRYLHPGVPLLFALAPCGLLAMALRCGVLQPFHIAWGLGLLGYFFVIMLTANVRARFRFAFEPFWFLYLAALLDVAMSAVARCVRREGSR